MTTEKAEKIFKSWQEYMEIADKLQKILGPSIPESFLPYPPEILEEALNITAEKFFDAGDKRKLKLLKKLKQVFFGRMRTMIKHWNLY